ncbi:hypothetical protein FRC10_003607 [Ceratobasidium sp. 414]|nr:hypothetical protein FRC10_003607 [Ceratobasidium sp. 414]
MALALGGPLLLYSLQALKDDKHDTSSDAENQGVSLSAPVQTLPSEATSIPSFVQSVQDPPRHSSPLFVTSVEWRAEPWKQLYYEYAVIYASASAQAAPTIAIRVDRHGKLGLKVPWWHIRPIYFFSNTNKRASTSVLARPIGDPITDPVTGTSVIKYTHWTHALPPSAPVSDLKRALERARNNACTALNHAVRPYVPNSLHMSDTQTRHARRWADSRGLQFVHVDIAGALADAMDTGMVRCALQTLWATVLPNRVLWRSVHKNTGVRREYLRVVNNYQQELLHLVDSLDSEARSKIALSWGIGRSETSSSLFVQLLTGSLSNHAFASPHAPIARLTDVASRLGTLAPIIPTPGPAQELCRLHADMLLARLPDKLWHAYTVSMHSVPPSKTCQTWRQIRNSSLFSLLLDITIQWFIALLLLPQDGPEGLWVVCTAMYHVIYALRWAFRERNAWGKIWKVYEGGVIQGGDEVWDESGTLSSLWSQSKASLRGTGRDSTYDISLDILG